MANPSVTIIMPFHNAAATIERTLSSIVAQTHRDIQIVMVNDGSDDNSNEVIERFVTQHTPFNHLPKLINLPDNKGVAFARATGMEHADGDYIIHCDADDYLHPSYIQQLYDTLKMQEADVVVSPMTYVSGNVTKVMPTSVTPDATLNDLQLDTATFSLCNKLISRRFIKEHDIIFFPGVDRWEDLGFFTQVMAARPVIAVCSMAGYYYVRVPKGQSLSGSESELLLRDHLKMALDIESRMIAQGIADRYRPFLDYLKFVSKIKYLRCRKRDVKKWKSVFPEVNGRIMEIRQLPLWIRALTRSIAILPSGISQLFASFADRLGK